MFLYRIYKNNRLKGGNKMEYTKTVWKDLPDTSTPITADRLNNIENGVEHLFEYQTEEFLSFTPTIKNATMTYSTQYGKYKYISGSTVMGVVCLRGNITSVTEPGYSRIKLNIPGVTSSNVQSWESFGIIQEALNGTDETPYCVIISTEENGDVVIGLQRSGGTAVAKWQVGNNVYIRVAFIINIAN
jgi:hypothetical protein